MTTNTLEVKNVNIKGKCIKVTLEKINNEQIISFEDIIFKTSQADRLKIFYAQVELALSNPCKSGNLFNTFNGKFWIKNDIDALNSFKSKGKKIVRDFVAAAKRKSTTNKPYKISAPRKRFTDFDGEIHAPYEYFKTSLKVSSSDSSNCFYKDGWFTDRRIALKLRNKPKNISNDETLTTSYIKKLNEFIADLKNSRMARVGKKIELYLGSNRFESEYVSLDVHLAVLQSYNKEELNAYNIKFFDLIFTEYPTAEVKVVEKNKIAVFIFDNKIIGIITPTKVLNQDKLKKHFNYNGIIPAKNYLDL